MTQHCPSCELRLPDQACFCSKCGYPLETTIKLKRVVGKRQPSLVGLQTHSVSSLLHFVLGKGTAMQYCPCCETEHPQHAHFCRHCGHALSATNIIDDTRNIGSSSVEVELPNVSTVSHRAFTRSQKALRKLPMFVQRFIAVILTRALDPEPERLDLNRQKALGSQALVWGWLPWLTLSSAFGTLIVAHAYTSARLGLPGADFFFWFGLLIIFVPATVRVLSPTASRFERICLLCIVAICFYLVKVMNSPLFFSSYDEFLHWRTADDITRSGHLFSINSLLPASPFYPGLEIATNALSSLSGLNTFTAGTIVIGVARLLLILALFMLYELLTNSPRIAALATLIYMTNPHFLLFDTQFAYESLALPLTIFLLFVMTYYEKVSLLLVRTKHSAAFKISSRAVHKSLNRSPHWITLTAWITLGAIVVTHHMTDFILDGLLLLWMVIYALRRPTVLIRLNLAQTALLGAFLSLVWMNLPGNPVVQYLAQYFTAALNEIEQILTGASTVRHLFVDYAGQTIPLWQRIMEISAVALISLGIPFGLLCLWQRYGHNALTYALGVATLGYPIIQILRFTNFGSEISDRASAFLFFPIAFVLAILIVQFWPTRRFSWKHTLLITCAILVMFLGGISIGSGTAWDILPGPYLVAADARSIEPEGIQAAIWAHSNLRLNNRIATDRTNQILMSIYGEQRVVTSLYDQIDVTPIFFAFSLSDYDVSIMRQAHIRYLVVDLRLSQALPTLGFYFEEGEPGSFQYTTPLDREALTKFSTVPQINRVFDSGDIVIYDVGGLSNVSRTT